MACPSHDFIYVYDRANATINKKLSVIATVNGHQVLEGAQNIWTDVGMQGNETMKLIGYVMPYRVSNFYIELEAFNAASVRLYTDNSGVAAKKEVR